MKNKQIQLVIKKDDLAKLPSTNDIKNKIFESLINGYKPDIIKPDFVRANQIRLPVPIIDKIENLAKEYGISETRIIRDMLGFDY